MQVAAVPYTTTQAEGVPDSKLQLYLEFLQWDTKEFSNEKLEAMLAASCLRYLEQLTDLNFVLGLSEKILEKQKRDMNVALHYATEILHNLSEKLQDHTIAVTDKATIDTYIDDAQEVITSRKYLHRVS